MNTEIEKKKVGLEEVFSPRGIAVVGISSSRPSFGGSIVQGLQAAGFSHIYPVNPKSDEIMGLRCYKKVSDIPGIVDHVVVSIPAGAILELLKDCVVKGVRSVHFFTAGFSEKGDAEGLDLEKQMLAIAREGGFRIVGPNSTGLYVPKNGVVNTMNLPAEAGPIAFLSQSGGHAINVPLNSRTRGLRFSKVISYGNASDIDEVELLEYFSQDSETEIIAAYIEGVRDGPRFAEALQKAAASKPVVIYKGGITEAGARATMGHTASMTSSADVFHALCRQKGAIMVEDEEELIDALVALRFIYPRPRGTNVGLVGAGGGPSVLASDQMEKEGLKLPVFSQEVQSKLKQYLPVDGSIFTNPLDTPNFNTPDAMSAALPVLTQTPDIDMLVFHLGFHPIGNWGMGRYSREFLQPLIEAVKKGLQGSEKPFLLAMRPPQNLAAMEEFFGAQSVFVEAGFPVFHSMRQLARAVIQLKRIMNAIA